MASRGCEGQSWVGRKGGAVLARRDVGSVHAGHGSRSRRGRECATGTAPPRTGRAHSPARSMGGGALGRGAAAALRIGPTFVSSASSNIESSDPASTRPWKGASPCVAVPPRGVIEVSGLSTDGPASNQSSSSTPNSGAADTDGSRAGSGAAGVASALPMVRGVRARTTCPCSHRRSGVRARVSVPSAGRMRSCVAGGRHVATTTASHSRRGPQPGVWRRL